MKNALRTLRSLRRPGDALYWQIDCHGDYRLRDFLRVGARSERELLLFLKRTFLPWVPLPLPRVPEFGCSTFATRTPDGHALFGRNFDLNRFSPPLTVRTAPADGYASVQLTRDDKGRIVRQIWYDLNGRAAVTADGYAGVAWAYDAAGRLGEVTYLDENGIQHARK